MVSSVLVLASMWLPAAKHGLKPETEQTTVDIWFWVPSTSLQRRDLEREGPDMVDYFGLFAPGRSKGFW
jgi:hypothetical protein